MYFQETMTIAEALRTHADVALVLESYGLTGCTRCSINQVETLAQAANSYGVPIDALLASLENLF